MGKIPKIRQQDGWARPTGGATGRTAGEAARANRKVINKFRSLTGLIYAAAAAVKTSGAARRTLLAHALDGAAGRQTRGRWGQRRSSQVAATV